VKYRRNRRWKMVVAIWAVEIWGGGKGGVAVKGGSNLMSTIIDHSHGNKVLWDLRS